MKLAAESNSIVTSDGETVTTSLEMEYDSANRLISYNNKKIKYDKDGNMLYGPVNGEMCNLTYDSRNRLISAGNVTYDYDAENTRISVTTTDKKITYVTDVAGEMSQLLESYEKTNDGKKTHTVYVYGNGLIYSYIDDGGDEADSITTDNKVQDLSSYISSDKDTDGTTYYHYNNIGSTTKLTDNNGNVIQSYEYGAYGEVLSGDTKITPFLYNGQLGVMTDDNGLYYMRARYYNVNIKRFINQDVVHGSINVSQSLNRYSYVQGNPIKLTDPFGLSPLGKINWSNVGHSALNILGCIKGWGWVFDSINAIWYACEGDYGMAALSLISALSDTGNMISLGLKSTKFARVGQYIGAITQLVSNAATFTQAAISGLENAKAIFRNAKNGKLLSIDTASNVAALGLNLFTTIVSGKGAVTSGKNIKKMIGTDVGNKWGNKANNKPLLECNLQFFAEKTSYGKSTLNSLKNTENYTDSAIEHIFEGQVNARGKAVGYHYEGIEGASGNVILGTESSVNNFGVYKAQVEVNGIPKNANGGFSTFYSKDMSPQQVVDSINEAYQNRVYIRGNTYSGLTSRGMEIEMFLDKNGKIISAYPVY